MKYPASFSCGFFSLRSHAAHLQPVLNTSKVVSICSLFSGQPPCSFVGVQHYSFDYAQQVHYPHYAQQVGPLFFKTPRKCQCFGICAEGSGNNRFSLYDVMRHSECKQYNQMVWYIYNEFMWLKNAAFSFLFFHRDRKNLDTRKICCSQSQTV